MMHPDYEKVLVYASEGKLGEELTKARQEFIEHTGDMFESDENYDRRIASFLEWYVLDRTLSFAAHQTPLKLFIEDVRSSLTTPQLASLRQLTRTKLSLYEFKGIKDESMKIVDLLTREKFVVHERRKIVGIESGDILEARLVPIGEHLTLTDAMVVHPRVARRYILKGAKKFRKAEDHAEGARFVHRVAYLSNRCERYGHLQAKDIFAELLKSG